MWRECAAILTHLKLWLRLCMRLPKLYMVYIGVVSDSCVDELERSLFSIQFSDIGDFTSLHAQINTNDSVSNFKEVADH